MTKVQAWTIIGRFAHLFCLQLSECVKDWRTESGLLLLCTLSVGWQKTSKNTHTHLPCLLSQPFHSLFIRVNGSESQGKWASKILPPAQKGVLILGQEALCWSPCGGLKVDSHTIVQCSTPVYHSLSFLICVFHTTKDTHTCLCLISCQWNP